MLLGEVSGNFFPDAIDLVVQLLYLLFVVFLSVSKHHELVVSHLSLRDLKIAVILSMLYQHVLFDLGLLVFGIEEVAFQQVIVNLCVLKRVQVIDVEIDFVVNNLFDIIYERSIFMF